MNLSLSISPCPNDTYMFYALLHGKIKTPFIFDVKYMDIDELNQNAGKFDVMKISSLAYTQVKDEYVVLNSGAALGNGCGPLLLSKKNSAPTENDLIAIPGTLTTANFLLQLYLQQKKVPVKIMLFSEIMPAIVEEKVTHGIVIHESRFTYTQYGLTKVVDLGEVWEQKYSLPIPLGLIVAKRSLGQEKILLLEQALYNSIIYPKNTCDCKEYIKKYAQEMDDSVMESHIKLYVNNYSKNLGKKGKRAIEMLMNKAQEMLLI